MSESTTPKVSVGFPVYNGGRYLRNALDRLLAQSFRDFELIICDNASTDETHDICQAYAANDRRIRYFRNPSNIGLAANHNRTFELSRGRYFKWAAADDDFPAEMLSRFVEVLDNAPLDVCAVYSQCEYIDAEGKVQAVDSDNVATSDVAPHRRLGHLLKNVQMYNSVYGLMRSETLRKTGLYGRFPMSDHVLLAELAMLGKIVEVPQPLLRIRRHLGRTFTANRGTRALRELFAPGEADGFPPVSLRTHMWLKLIGAAVHAPVSVKERILCTWIAVTAPQWRSFKSSAGRQRRKMFRMFSTVRPAYRAGDWVVVKSKEEILETLDANGRVDGMPFMPEMFAFCGQRFRVYKRAHKTCDTVHEYKARSLSDAVHLSETRCNGAFHGGCQAGCMLFWKTPWLRTLDQDLAPFMPEAKSVNGNNSSICTEADVTSLARKPADQDPEPAYMCQATELPAATKPLGPWEWRQYLEDFTSGNVGLGRIARSFALVAYRRGLVNLGIGLGPMLKWVYDRIKSLWGGTEYPFRDGAIPTGSRTPTGVLDLRPGELVRVKNQAAIVATLDQSRRNRGMTFDPEMVPYCGGTYPVLRRVGRILDEKTGKVLEMKNPCVVLDNVICQARYCDNRLFCPRAGYPFWREIWLERIDDKAESVEK